VIDVTPAFRLYARRRRAALLRQDAVASQDAELKKLLARAKNTRFGREHGFARIRTVADFQRAIPLRRYDDFWKTWWQPDFPVLDNVTWPGRIPYFAASSGTTTGGSKFIPVTHEMNRANGRASFDLLIHHLAHRPHSRALGGKTFMLGGSTALVERAPGVQSGDLSGIAVKRLNWLLRRFTFPPPEIARLTDWDEKTDAIAARAIHEDIRILGGTPPWLLQLFEKQQHLLGHDATARELYPHLELLVHGGVNFRPYRARFERFLAGGAELREAYPASEGFIAAQDETPEAGLRLMADNGLFFEFVPVEELNSANPTRHTVADAEPGVNYALALSTCAGAFAYLIGDTVRFVSRNPPRLLVTGRTSYSMSAFGEHLIGEEIENAVTAASAAIGIPVTDYSMGAVFPRAAGEIGRHLYVVEFARPASPQQIARFAETIDAALAAANDDYRHYRLEVRGLAPPEILSAPHGSFAAWMKRRGKLGAQHKVPRVINDADLFADLVSFMQRT
jgi:hypothetical protein